MSALPDAEALLVEALGAHPSVTALCGGRVGTRLSGTYPAIRVTLLGGPDRPTVDAGVPGLQVECWGDGSDGAAETQASDMARAVEAAATDLAGNYPAGKVRGSTVYGYILHSPDQTTGRERYIVQVSLLTQP